MDRYDDKERRKQRRQLHKNKDVRKKKTQYPDWFDPDWDTFYTVDDMQDD